MRRKLSLTACFIAVFLLAASAFAGEARNVILMIADGAGYNTWIATSLYQTGEEHGQVYDKFPVKMGMSTFPAGASYDPKVYWASFEAAKKIACTDSAAAATAMATGVKTKNGIIAQDPAGKRLDTIAELAAKSGRSCGVITTVDFADATPACFAAHNDSRVHLADIAREMLTGDTLTVIMGCGHPLYDAQGQPTDQPDYTLVGGHETWQALVDKTLGGKNPWTLMQTADDFDKLAAGTLHPARVFGLPCNRATLQHSRAGDWKADPFAVPMAKGVPTLETMARGALAVLAQNKKGFFVMIEGGAVDHANHNRQPGRMIEEQIDFNRAVEAVVAWVEKNGGWDETLLIITADHETGFVWGADSGPEFKPVVGHGKGNMPDFKHYSGQHTNALVPVFAKGAGSELFKDHIAGNDPRRGDYVDNTALFGIMRKAMKVQ